jgi:hypothetical protein
MKAASKASAAWPALPYEEWRETCESLHLWLQLVGKVRLALTPWVNHSWHATYYVTTRGLTTSTMWSGRQALEGAFDFLTHSLELHTSRGALLRLPLTAPTVAEFRTSLERALAELDIDVKLNDTPNEIPDAVPFSRDTEKRRFDPTQAERFWRVLLQVDRVFRTFRTGFVGKVSPVHLFWGSMDLAVTRFSGRAAPPHPGGVPALPDAVTREAYSHEVSSAGFWPGDAGGHDASFYSYAYPEPDGFRDTKIDVEGAYYDETLHEFLLPYEAVRKSADPEHTLFTFLENTYEAAARNGNWDRSLECSFGRLRVPRTP